MSDFDATILDRLSEATADELNQALAAIRQDSTAFEGQAATADVLAAVTGLRDAATAIRGELTARAALADETSTALDALADLTAPPEPEFPAEPDAEA